MTAVVKEKLWQLLCLMLLKSSSLGLSPIPGSQQPAVTLCPLSPSFVPPHQEELAIDRSSVCPLMNTEKSTALFTSRSRSNALHQAQWCLAQACVYKLLAHHLFWLRYSLQTNKTDGIQ